MEKKDDAVYLSRWSVILPAIGVAITGGALWYNNLVGSKDEVAKGDEINQSASDNVVNVSGGNTGVINTGVINTGVINTGVINTDVVDAGEQ